MQANPSHIQGINSSATASQLPTGQRKSPKHERMALLCGKLDNQTIRLNKQTPKQNMKTKWSPITVISVATNVLLLCYITVFHGGLRIYNDIATSKKTSMDCDATTVRQLVCGTDGGVATSSAKDIINNKADTTTDTTTNNNEASTPLPPLQVYPLLKEFRVGWGNTEIPPILNRRNATNPYGAAGDNGDPFHGGRLVVDIGLDSGDEFRRSMRNGFEVVGFEPNPLTYRRPCGAPPTPAS